MSSPRRSWRTSVLGARVVFWILFAASLCVFALFRHPPTQNAGITASAAQEAACAQLDRSFVKGQNEQIPSGYAMITSDVFHYDAMTDSCMIEMDFRTAFRNATWADNYVLFNATEDRIVADCLTEGGADAAAPFCNDDAGSAKGVVPQMSRQAFDALVAGNMTE